MNQDLFNQHDFIKQIVYKVMSKLKGNEVASIHPQPFPVGISNRHVHLSRQDLEILFGSGYELNKSHDISQTGQFAAKETVNLAGPKGCIEKVRILGPVRKQTQVEIMRSDKFKLGVNPPVRDSGDLKDSGAITIIGPRGSVHINEGLIIAQRHVHMSPADAILYGVSDGEFVQVKAGTNRGVTFDQVLIRVREDFVLELHLDIDEANAAGVENGEGAFLVTLKNKIKEQSGIIALSLITEDEVRQAWKEKKPIYIKKGSITTPLAKDTAKELGVELISL
mgnify:CR=1 FL=1